jgi:hypothetical protein
MDDEKWSRLTTDEDRHGELFAMIQHHKHYEFVMGKLTSEFALARDAEGRTPLHYMKGYHEDEEFSKAYADKLIGLDADVNAKDKYGRTPMFSLDMVHEVRNFAEEYPNVKKDVQDNEKQTVFHRIIDSYFLEDIVWLLMDPDWNAVLELKDNQGKSVKNVIHEKCDVCVKEGGLLLTEADDYVYDFFYGKRAIDYAIDCEYDNLFMEFAQLETNMEPFSRIARDGNMHRIQLLLSNPQIKNRLLEYNKEPGKFTRSLLFNAIVFSRKLQLVKELFDAGFEIPESYLVRPLDIMFDEHSDFGFVPDESIRAFLCSKYKALALAEQFPNVQKFYKAAYYNGKHHTYNVANRVRSNRYLEDLLKELPLRQNPDEKDESLFARKFTWKNSLNEIKYTVLCDTRKLYFYWYGNHRFCLTVRNELDKSLSIVKASELLANNKVFELCLSDNYDSVDDLWPKLHKLYDAQFVYFRNHTLNTEETHKRMWGFVPMFHPHKAVENTWEFEWNNTHTSIIKATIFELFEKGSDAYGWRIHSTTGEEADIAKWTRVMEEVVHNTVSFKIYSNMFKGRKPRVTKLEYDSLTHVKTRWTMLPKPGRLESSSGTGDEEVLHVNLNVTWDDFNA